MDDAVDIHDGDIVEAGVEQQPQDRAPRGAGAHHDRAYGLQ